VDVHISIFLYSGQRKLNLYGADVSESPVHQLTTVGEEKVSFMGRLLLSVQCSQRSHSFGIVNIFWHQKWSLSCWTLLDVIGRL
jgi:hypothetical protein